MINYSIYKILLNKYSLDPLKNNYLVVTKKKLRWFVTPVYFIYYYIYFSIFIITRKINIQWLIYFSSVSLL